MQTKNLIKALKKIGLDVEIEQRKAYDHFAKEYVMTTPQITAQNERNKICFYDQDGSVVCCQVMGVKQDNDYMTDYFPGYFARTIKSAISGMLD